ncbi:hypothetical protein ACLESO_28590 [Pyxidicoccus sp. 3LG]
MSVLRRFYEEARQLRPFSLEDLARDFSFKDGGRFAGAQKTKIIPSRVTKTDPVEDALLRLRQQLEEASRSAKQPRIGDEPGVFQFPPGSQPPRTDVQHGQQPVVVGTLISRNAELQFQELSREYASGDAERVVIEGTLTGTDLQVSATAWRKGQTLQMAVTFSGFTEPTFEFLQQLSGYSYCDVLHHVVLSEHRLIFATTDTQWRVGDVEVPLKAGTNVLATLGFHPNLARLMETGTQGKKLLLFGPIPDDEEADLEFLTAPLARFQAGTLRVDSTYVRISVGTTVTRDEDGEDSFRETHVDLIGSTQVGSEPRAIIASLPADHELLQWRMMFGVLQPAIALPDADGLMGGDAWRAVFGERLPPPANPTLQIYNHNTLLPTGKVTSISMGLASGGWKLKYQNDFVLSFHTIDFRWVVGLPDAAATTNIYLVGVGHLTVTDGLNFVVPSTFEAQVTFMPEFGISAAATGVGQDVVRRLVQALRLVNPPEGDPQALQPPFNCTFTLNTQRTLTCIGSDGARCTWRGQ